MHGYTLMLAWLVIVAFALLLVSLVPSATPRALSDCSIRRVLALPTTARHPFYPHHRAPLVADPLIKLPIGSIAPRGWLRRQLELMRDGMVGRLPELSKFCQFEGNAWVSRDGEGDCGWEEVPYWLRGYGDLGYVLRDERIVADARRWIEGVLASQAADGYFGPRINQRNGDLWPNMVMLNVLQSFHEATGDPRVLPFMTKYFRYQLDLPRDAFLPGSWQKLRAADNLASIHWLYSRTGEARLLELGRVVHERAARWDAGIADWHGVNICQGFRGPAVFHTQSADRRHLDAAERNYLAVMAMYGQAPGGMFAADENCRPGHHGARQAAETCSMVELMHSHEMLLKLTGDAIWADRCEEIGFNSLPAAVTPDWRGLHYLTAPNMVRLDRNNKAPGLENDGCMLAFDPYGYRCCQHNVSMGWPYFAEHLWLATHDAGLAAVLYAASEVTARVGDGAEVRIIETTGYPFDETISLRIHAGGAVRFPLYLRIPAWCTSATVAINDVALDAPVAAGGYLRIEQTWRDGDEVRIVLSMSIALTTWRSNGHSVSVHRGPLTYSLKIGETWQRYGGTDEWPAHEVLPATAWNYGLLLVAPNPVGSFEVVRPCAASPDDPFTPDAAPIALRARGRRIPTWKLDNQGLIEDPPASPAPADGPPEPITLIPMGCARLRVSAFPPAAGETS